MPLRRSSISTTRSVGIKTHIRFANKVSLLEEIQSSAIDADSDLGTVLRQCKLLAARLGSQELEDWLLWESNGYPDDVDVPEYRVWPLAVRGRFASVRWIRTAPVPAACLPDNVAEVYGRYQCKLSIAAVESALRKNTSGIIQVPTGDLALMLNDVYRHENCIESWAEFSTANLVELLNTVRNRILDFALALWKQHPQAGEQNAGEAITVPQATVTQIFNTTVYGGAANVVGSAADSSVTFNVNQGDFASLRQALMANDVADEDVQELEQALQAEPAPAEGGGYGPRVSAWVATMMQKAADGSWQIGVGAAGTLVAQLIAKFYGLG